MKYLDPKKEETYKHLKESQGIIQYPDLERPMQILQAFFPPKKKQHGKH